MAKTKNPDISKVGMVTNAVWADVTGDKIKELIIVGEWMPPRIFSYNGDHFTEIKTNLRICLAGGEQWSATDINGDGQNRFNIREYRGKLLSAILMKIIL